jgi:hypothetical protein
VVEQFSSCSRRAVLKERGKERTGVKPAAGISCSACAEGHEIHALGRRAFALKQQAAGKELIRFLGRLGSTCCSRGSIIAHLLHLMHTFFRAIDRA